MICNFWTRQKSAFCMRFDPLWYLNTHCNCTVDYCTVQVYLSVRYGVYEVLAPALVFKITVDVRKKGRNIWLGNEEQAVWNTVSKFVISPSVPARASRDGRVSRRSTKLLEFEARRCHVLCARFEPNGWAIWIFPKNSTICPKNIC